MVKTKMFIYIIIFDYGENFNGVGIVDCLERSMCGYNSQYHCDPKRHIPNEAMTPNHFTLSGGGTLDGQGNVQVYDAKDKGFKTKPMLSLNFSARTGSPQLNTITLGDKIPMPIDLPDPTLNGLARNQHSCVPIGKTDDRPGACGARGEYAERPTCAPS
uniref:Uncharacterized protein n=1 Tax=Ipomoea trifida TaxID=35884 RepID=Q6JJ30_IPOTF|nr:hypothetical protein [Ipomoea trifida]